VYRLPSTSGSPRTVTCCTRHQRLLGILPAQRVDHGAQRGKPTAPFERRPPVLIEEFVVDLELCVNVGGPVATEAICVRNSRRVRITNLGRSL